MRVIQFISDILGWLLTLVFQVVVSYLAVFLLSVIFNSVDTSTRLGWLESLLGIFFGYLIGINLVGQVTLRWAWKSVRLLSLPRLAGSAVGALIPLLILLPIGYSVPNGVSGTQFYDLVGDTWQPILAQASLFVAILGFYLPGMVALKATQNPT
jgi:hypothetical protein